MTFVEWDGKQWQLEEAVRHNRNLAKEPDSRTLKTIPLVEGRNILDIGCGAGVVSFLVSERFPQAHVTGVDTNPDAIKIAKLAFQRPNLEFRVVDANKLASLKKGSFDCVLLLEVIEHLDNPGLVIDSIGKLLKKGGVFIVSTPNAAGYESFLRNLRKPLKMVTKVNAEPLWSGTHTDHLVAWDLQTLYRLLKRKGFTYADHRFVGFGFPFTKLGVRPGSRRARLLSSLLGPFATGMILKVRKD